MNSRKRNRDIVVVGASAGGPAALTSLLSQFTRDFPATIFLVQHLGPESTGKLLLDRLQKQCLLECRLAVDQARFKRGQVWLAPPDRHLLIKPGRLLVSKGARENRYRPSLDPLFRSAAVAYGNRVIGVVLTGALDDGTAGLAAIKKCGGLTIVQQPADATHPDMPQSALENVAIDHALPLAELGGLLRKLTRKPSGKARRLPPEIKMEARIAERVLSDVDAVNRLGTQVPFNCPNAAACSGR